MKTEEMKCPGCGRHCPLTAPKCNFGKQYLEKKQLSLSSESAKIIKRIF